MRVLQCCLVALLLVGEASSPADDVVATDNVVREETLAIAFRQVSPFNVHAACEVELSIATDNVVRLELRNDTGGKIFLNNPETSCGCVSVEPSKPQLLPGDSCALVVKLRPDGNYAKHVWVQRVSFPPPDGQEGDTASLMISSKLRGLLAFDPTSLVLIASSLKEQADEPVKAEFDIFYSSPINPENFEFSGSPWIDLLDIDVVNGDDEGVAKCSVQVKSSDIPMEGTHGHLQIKDTRTGDFRVLRISMIRRSPIRTAPSTLVFRESKETGKMEAFALLIRENTSGPENKNSESDSNVSSKVSSIDTPVFFSAAFGTQTVETRILSGAERFRRLHISLDAKIAEELLADKESPVLNWRASWDELSVNEKSSVLFPSIRKRNK